MKIGAILVGLVMLAVLGLGLWYQSRNPRVIVANGTVRVESRARPGSPMTLETRHVQVGPTEFDEVRMPNGTWIGCAGDCSKAALDAGPDFWDVQARDRGR